MLQSIGRITALNPAISPRWTNESTRSSGSLSAAQPGTLRYDNIRPDACPDRLGSRATKWKKAAVAIWFSTAAPANPVRGCVPFPTPTASSCSMVKRQRSLDHVRNLRPNEAHA